MSTVCGDIVDLPVGDKILISWPVKGLGEGGVAEVSLNDGAWAPLTIAGDEVQGIFAGPTHASPGGAVVVTIAAHVEVRITTSTQQTTQDGGFIRLVP